MEAVPGVGKLIKKHRRKKAASLAESNSDGAESLRGRSPAGRTSTPGELTSTLLPRTPAAEEGEASSLLSYESEPEGSLTRPGFPSTHPSQIGYLTTNSPLVQAAHQPESQPTETQPTETQASETSFRSLAYEADSTASLETAPSLGTSKASLGAPPQPTRRSPSPVGRIKDAFSRGKKHSIVSDDALGARGDGASGTAIGDQNNTTADLSDVPRAGSVSRGVRRQSRGQRIETDLPPRTPPSGEVDTPTITNTPPTPTDPNHPQQTSGSSETSPASSNSPHRASASLGGMLTQRRGRAGSASIGPSKLSNITSAPLTPTPEDGQATPSSGFFSSVLSAAQNAANTINNTIQNSNIGQAAAKNKALNPLQLASSSSEQVHDQADQVEVESTADVSSTHSMEKKEPAIKTLGMGDLSLSQLGLNEAKSTANTPVTGRFPDAAEPRGRSESAPTDSQASTLHEDERFGARTNSMYEPGAAPGESTPPTGSLYEGQQSSIHRSGSIRSAIERRRKRGSSAATGGTGGSGMTIGAAIAAANSSLANPAAAASAPKLTGFAVASKKRNRDFHNLFKSVPDDDYLIEDYSCALQREILAHGRLYVSEGHLCFSSNILGWVTTLVMSFDEIVSVEKRSTALVFKNGLEISTLHAKHIFASFTSRDSTYDLIIKIWKLGHPGLKSSLNGVRLDGTGGDKTEKVDAESVHSHSGSASEGEEESDDGEDVYDEDEDADDTAIATQATEGAAGESEPDKTVARKPSGAVVSNGTAGEKSADGAAAASSVGADFPGPATHAATDCGDTEKHYDKIIGDDVIPAPLGKVFGLCFGPASVKFMSDWLTTNQKCWDLQMDDKKGLTESGNSRTYSYMKPLGGSIGPSKTKCVVTETVEHLEYEKAVNVICSTATPDVPSGNVFTTKTKYCFSWAEGNGTRVQANCTVEWTGKSWLKGPIEKGAADGQTTYCKELYASLKSAVSSRPRSATNSNSAGGGAKGKKKGRKGKAGAPSASPTSDSEDAGKKRGAPAKSDWGMLEPLHPFLGPVVGVLAPLLTGNVVYGLLVGLLVAAWFGFGFTTRQGVGHSGPAGYGYGAMHMGGFPDRLAAYEEMWRREESELWAWLEERVGLDRLSAEPGSSESSGKEKGARQKSAKQAARTVEEKLREEGMDEREIREAIRVTEEKLGVLKGVVERKAGERKGREKAAAGVKHDGKNADEGKEL